MRTLLHIGLLLALLGLLGLVVTGVVVFIREELLPRLRRKA